MAIKVERSLGDLGENAATYGLDSPTQVLLSRAETEVLRLDLGSQRSGGGQFIAADKKIYLISKDLSADSKLHSMGK